MIKPLPQLFDFILIAVHTEFAAPPCTGPKKLSCEKVESFTYRSRVGAMATVHLSLSLLFLFLCYFVYLFALMKDFSIGNTTVLQFDGLNTALYKNIDKEQKE